MIYVIMEFTPIFLGFAAIIFLIYRIFFKIKKHDNKENLNKIEISDLPLYEHDCNNCVFLGKYTEDNHVYDLYFCNNEPTTVIARYSNIGSDYISGLAFAKPSVNSILYEAKKRAIERNLYEEV